MHKMKLKRYVTETGWGSLSDIFKVHQIIVSVFVYYLELERRRPKFNHRRLNNISLLSHEKKIQ